MDKAWELGNIFVVFRLKDKQKRRKRKEKEKSLKGCCGLTECKIRGVYNTRNNKTKGVGEQASTQDVCVAEYRIGLQYQTSRRTRRDITLCSSLLSDYVVMR